MKIYTKEISYCSECPNHYEDGGDGESPWTFNKCSALEAIGKSLKEHLFPVIPRDCPLPDKKGA